MKTQEFTPSDDVIEDITIEDNGHLIDYGYLEPIGEDDDIEFYNATGIQI